MLPPSYLDQMPDAFVQLWQQVEEQILQDVARRIGKMDKVTPTANWQLWRYQQTEAVRNDVVKLLAKYTGKSETAIRKLLLQAATAAQAAFEAIKAKIAASGQAQGSKGKIVIATVKGDVHDIGKNIVRVILENYGYDVLDLGRDVDPERVVEAVRQTGAKLVGLSALMTTTVPNMQATIEALHAAHLDCKVMVGGAVLTPDYARDIGADYYCKDAKASADLAKQLLD